MLSEDLLMNFCDTLPDQENTAGKQDYISHGKSGFPDRKERFCQLYNPGDQGKQDNPENQGHNHAYGSYPGLLFSWKFARGYRNENDIVNPQHNLQESKGQQGYVGFGLQKDFHGDLLD
jgi:hypothetical protein